MEMDIDQTSCTSVSNFDDEKNFFDENESDLEIDKEEQQGEDVFESENNEEFE
ncbi:hypothetical protein I4U23_022368 [Adineta vaga]|nr:hypothetical protein I4U23_022368 [Adineta vaga]